MDVTAAVDEGMSTRRFFTLCMGLSAGATWRIWHRDRPRFLEGDAAERYFAGIG